MNKVIQEAKEALKAELFEALDEEEVNWEQEDEVKKNSNTIIEIEHVNTGEIKLKEEKTKFVAFYADIPHNKINEVIEDIKTWYEDTKTYLIGLEYKEAREHYHFVIDFTDIEYAAYVKRVLKGKYKLSGRRSQKGHTGQYGKVSKIRNIDAMCSYTLKDLDYYTNFKPERIKALVEASYPRPENDTMEFIKECMEYVKKNLSWMPETNLECQQINDSPREVATLVIKFLRINNKCLTASTIRKYTMRYITYESSNYNNDQLFGLLFPHGI